MWNFAGISEEDIWAGEPGAGHMYGATGNHLKGML